MTVIKNEKPNKIELPESISEITVLTSDKIHYNTSLKQAFPSMLTRKWDGEKYKQISEIEIMGKRHIKVSDSDNTYEQGIKSIGTVLGKEKAEKLKNIKRLDPKEVFLSSIWSDFFPLILLNPLESNFAIKYIGKAKASNTIAKVVDIKPKNGNSYRLFFDTNTNYLLMMILNCKVVNGVFEAKYYYSNREKMNGILIPKTIKVEQKLTRNGEEPRISYINMEIMDFNLNPKLKESLFDID